MKTILFSLPLLALMASCNRAPEKKAKAAAPNYQAEMLSTNQDFVCGMELTSEMIADTAQFEGKTYGFCHSGCKEAFKKEPAKYLSQN